MKPVNEKVPNIKCQIKNVVIESYGNNAKLKLSRTSFFVCCNQQCAIVNFFNQLLI